MNKRRVAVIGIGLMGQGIAHCFARYGFEVITVTRKGENKMKPYLEKELRKKHITQEEFNQVLSNIVPVTMEDFDGDVELAIEAVHEQKDLKHEVFKKLEEKCHAETILATTTSTIPVGFIAQVVTNKSRVVGMHFCSPVTRMTIVEVIKGAETSEETIVKAKEYSLLINKEPLVVKDFPGFVISRLVQAVVNEAALIYMQGVADAETIDRAAQIGMSLPVGPLKLADLVGIDVALRGLDSMREMMGDDRYNASPVIRQKVYEGHIGRKVGKGFYEYND
ncbi:3-hydroxybutyryl-CoA dehydrogenase [Cytobacillus oceanisediminis]|jgi:3-hydroxybutyryl-CoA dehydrogenase|uniref:3-hydroxybutyryl-CoA dehydrogenase n=1 Tax=Cytobacillus oceanisediminis TaxID=665099 RepID=A0A2V2ZY63_9BACI|nr:3-hydroxyacyl-CoA dehydrogenase family protein [Cytobacillus oceanisediminis]PWW28919.1 3-hydroxybutyryl-CoA dehydrogenase [Cytobacillus oceanisediminis]